MKTITEIYNALDVDSLALWVTIGRAMMPTAVESRPTHRTRPQLSLIPTLGVRSTQDGANDGGECLALSLIRQPVGR